MRISVDAGKCTRCRCCEFICYFARAEVFNPVKARIKVVNLDYLGFSNPVVCLLCKKPACVEVCPTEALSRTEAGTTLVDEGKCDACGFCITLCPRGALTLIDKSDKSRVIWDGKDIMAAPQKEILAELCGK